eukprot:1185914-Prorocentrum_minimum.AAC.2
MRAPCGPHLAEVLAEVDAPVDEAAPSPPDPPYPPDPRCAPRSERFGVHLSPPPGGSPQVGLETHI